jgi:hypothetical protein
MGHSRYDLDLGSLEDSLIGQRNAPSLFHGAVLDAA